MATENTGKKLGFWSLTAIVFGMMVGSGLYNIPQNLAVGAGPLASALAWMITAAGMLLLVGTFKMLADRRPDLNAGIYQYAQVGFGDFTGFVIAWGYWLCIAFANIAYSIMLNDSFGAFFPKLLDHGLYTLIFCTVLIWGMYFLVSGGIKTARFINNLMAVIKVGSIILVVVLLILNFRFGILSGDILNDGFSSGSLALQIKNTMLITLWCFIGIEGAVMMSARAKRPSDVGKAGVAGFFVAWLLYFLVSMLCYGVMTRARLAGLQDPSVAYVLQAVCGSWAYYFVILAIIFSLLGGWLAWTLVCAQVPYEAASVGIFPKVFMKLNKHDMPGFGLVVSSIAMETFLLMVLMADDVYLMALNVASVMVLPAYLMSGIFLLKICFGEKGNALKSKEIVRGKLLGMGCTLYCFWLIYAAGLDMFAFTTFFYLAGVAFYVRSIGGKHFRSKIHLTRGDLVTISLLVIGLVVSIVQLL